MFWAVSNVIDLDSRMRAERTILSLAVKLLNPVHDTSRPCDTISLLGPPVGKRSRGIDMHTDRFAPYRMRSRLWSPEDWWTSRGVARVLTQQMLTTPVWPPLRRTHLCDTHLECAYIGA